jgi:Heavy metal associated domain 2
MSHYVHHVPGRLRIKSQVFKNSDGNAAAVRRVLGDLVGVHATEINELTGSLLVRYDKSVLSSTKILALLVAHGVLSHLPDLEPRPAPKGVLIGFREHAIRNLIVALPRIIADVVIEKLLQRAALALVAAVV